jgi:hypothetical protein
MLTSSAAEIVGESETTGLLSSSTSMGFFCYLCFFWKNGSSGSKSIFR